MWSTHPMKRHVTDMPAQCEQYESAFLERKPACAFPLDVSINGFDQCHRTPTRLNFATARSARTSCFAYTLTESISLWPKKLAISRRGVPLRSNSVAQA